MNFLNDQRGINKYNFTKFPSQSITFYIKHYCYRDNKTLA